MTELSKLLGRSPDQLALPERAATRGKWIALELYSPSTLPLKRIEAVGDTIGECASVLVSRGLDPRNFEFVLQR